jgi:hypothetical protein
VAKTTKATSPPERVTEKFTSTLKVELTAEEVAERADRAAQMLADRDRKEEEQKAAAKHAKSVIESMDADRPVDCERCSDYVAGRYRETRLDTGEVFVDRPLTEAEKQRPLFETNGEA